MHYCTDCRQFIPGVCGRKPEATRNPLLEPVTPDANELLRAFGGCRCSDDLSTVCEAHDSLSWYAFRVLESARLSGYALPPYRYTSGHAAWPVTVEDWLASVKAERAASPAAEDGS